MIGSGHLPRWLGFRVTRLMFSTRHARIQVAALASVLALGEGCGTPYDRPGTTVVSSRSTSGRDTGAQASQKTSPGAAGSAEARSNSADAAHDASAVPWGISASHLPGTGMLSVDEPGARPEDVPARTDSAGADPMCVALISHTRTPSALASDLRRGVVLGAARTQRRVVELSLDSQPTSAPLPCALGIGLSDAVAAWHDSAPASPASRFVAVALKERDGHRGACGAIEGGGHMPPLTHLPAAALGPRCRHEAAHVSVVDLTLATQRGRLRSCLADRAAAEVRRDRTMTSVRLGDPTDPTPEVESGTDGRPPFRELVIAPGLSSRALSDVLKAERRRHWGWAVLLSLPPDIARLVAAWVGQNAQSAPALTVATSAGRHPEALAAAGDSDSITWASSFAPAASHAPAATFVDDYARLYQDLPSELALAGWQAAQLSGGLSNMPRSLLLPLFLWEHGASRASRCDGERFHAPTTSWGP